MYLFLTVDCVVEGDDRKQIIDEGGEQQSHTSC